MSVIVFTLILLVTMISLKKRKKEEESFEPQQFFEFEENNIEEFKEKTPIVEEKKVKNNCEGEITIQENEEKKQINSIEENKKFSLKEAVIYSSILERPYK
ncbi:MAG: hypothetical protein U0K90_03880 [Bacteroidales bacterium]|nr:hypothetical protein [Bacteroidales bacterium]